MASFTPLSVSDLEKRILKLSNDCKHPPGTKSPFIPKQALCDYLSTPNLFEELLDDLDIQQTFYDGILNNCLIVFSILLQLRKHTEIPKFLERGHLFDNYLPFLEADKEKWPPECRDFFNEFYKKQWQFCVKKWEKGKLAGLIFEKDALLPIVESTTLRDGTNSCTFKIELCPEYNGLDEKTNNLVLKSCSRDNRRLYQNEVDSYQVLMRQPDVLPHIVTLHGHFEQHDTFNLVLEYVNGGTLETLFENGERPQSPTEILIFWSSFVKLFNPLYRMHELYICGRKWGATHQDIKPKNILVSRVEGSKDYNIAFKLIDFAFTRFQQRTSDVENQNVDEGGTQMYSAPELCKNDRFLQRSKFLVDLKIDTWAFGAVLSETLIWCTLGREGLDTYRQRRRESTVGNPLLDKGGYEGCFHDGNKILSVVQEAHKKALKAAESNIYLFGLTSRMIDLIEQMLNEAEDRPSDKVVYKTLGSIIRDTEASISSQDARILGGEAQRVGNQKQDTTRMTPPQLPPGYRHSNKGQNRQLTENMKENHESIQSQPAFAPGKIEPLSSSSLPPGILRQPERGGPSEPVDLRIQRTRFEEQPEIRVKAFPEVKVVEAFRWLQGVKKGSSDIELPGFEFRNKLAGREQFFLFDDSASMTSYWLIENGVNDIFKVLGYLTKNISTSGLHAYFGLSRRYFREKNRAKIIREIRNYHPQVGSRCDMQYSLKAIFQHWWKKNRKWLEGGLLERSSSMRFPLPKKSERKQGLNVYVLTNGAWQTEAGTHCAVASEINAIYNKMKDNQLDQSLLRIQFIRFGDDTEFEGFRRLENMAAHLRNLGINDNVHTEPSSGNIWKMLLG
ncbi:kinase-like domain-containing protein [Phaeosphaeriaceae sp. PMI808]|nr:kinase-like domain-containing protein [Phaeosphaeriaceae sp. PMI808]